MADTRVTPELLDELEAEPDNVLPSVREALALIRLCRAALEVRDRLSTMPLPPSQGDTSRMMVELRDRLDAAVASEEEEEGA